MQIHCNFCHRPMNISRREAEAALEVVHAEGLEYYEFKCPHCRKMNKVPSEVLHRAAPNWKPSEVSAS